MKKLILSMLSLAMFAACNNEDSEINIENNGPKEVRFSASSTTSRAAIEGTVIPTGSEIGIYGLAVKVADMETTTWETADIAFKSNLENALYTIKPTKDGGQEVVADKVAKYPYAADSALIFYAYIPRTTNITYTAGAAPTIPVEGTAAMADVIDYLYLPKIASQATMKAVNLNFRHAFARVDVQIMKSSEEGTPDAILKEIRITTQKGQKGTMAIDNGQITYAEPNDGITEILYRLNDEAAEEAQVNQSIEYKDTKARFLILPDNDAIKKVELVLKRSDKEYAVDTEYIVYTVQDKGGTASNTAIDLEAGKITTLKVKYTPKDATFTTSVTDWEGGLDYEFPAH